MRLRGRGTKRKERGQISLMVAMMMVTFIMLFAFVVNTGMLVHAKINLQNAADLAAYAGAAVQARQLNQVSYLNYEMRRQYKKFLFRYYVIGNMAQQTFPRDGGTGEPPWTPRVGSPPLGLPIVCIITNKDDNFCQNPSLQKIVVPDPSDLDQIQTAVNAQLKAIEQLRQDNCVAIGQLNKITLRLWLFNTEPEGKDLSAALPAGADAKAQGLLATTRTLTLGLGLVPREIILSLRAKTLEKYLNEPAKKDLTLEKVSDLRTAEDQVQNERTVLAFMSAHNTLGDHTFPSDSVTMDELLSGGDSSADLVRLEPIRARFDTYFAEFIKDAPDRNGASNCNMKVVPLTLPAPGIPVGIHKSLKTLAYYAVRLKARARLMFNPFGDFELKAYSAAQPFGSRIGPLDEEMDQKFVRTGANILGGALFQSAGALGLVGAIPNLPVREQDGTGQGAGWDRQEVLSQMYSQLKDDNGILESVNADTLNHAYQAAMTPNPAELGFYNIPSSLPDPYDTLFDRDHIYRFWAPVLPLDQKDKINDTLKSELQALFASDDGGSTDNTQVRDLETALLETLSQYITKLGGPTGGENGEGFKFAAIQDPYFDVPRAGGGSGEAKPIVLGGGVQLAPTAENVKTSWADPPDGRLRTPGRTGYSVKFVPFSTLMSKNVSTNGAGQTWENDMNLPEDAAGDVARIKH